MNYKTRTLCDICSVHTVDIAFNCSACVIDICAPCARKYTDVLSFAHHLSLHGRLALLEGWGCIHDSENVLYGEYHSFNNTDIYRQTIAKGIAKTENEIKEAESLVVELKKQLEAQKHTLAVSMRRIEME